MPLACIGRRVLGALFVVGFGPSLVQAAPAPDFVREIRPIFEQRCFVCHGEQLQQGELRLDQRERALRGGGSGVAAITPGDSERSLLYRYVAGLDEGVRMPPAEPFLDDEQVRRIKEWIDAGAAWPEQGRSEQEPAEPSKFDRAKDHWSFQPLHDPAPPPLQDPQLVARARNPIDAFVFSKLERKGWTPAPEAEPRQLLRRLYLDLTGLPPTPAEQESFLQDPSPEAFDRLVDELLARPSYGERWGRHWLDLVRYAETNGYERDAVKPSVWRYRDYVIRAFNDDKPFDRFALEQLAGDELPDLTPETLIATGFYRLGPWDDEPADPATDRYDQLDDLVRTTSEVFLGLTIGCARCHNHKFEPLTAADYYSMAAIFAPLTRPRAGRRELLQPIAPLEELDALEQRDGQVSALERRIAAIRLEAQNAFLRSGRSALPQRAVDALLTPQAERDQVQAATAAEFSRPLAAEMAEALPMEARLEISELEDRICELHERTPTRDAAYILHEPRGEPAPSALLIRGKATSPGPEVEPATPAVLSRVNASFPPWSADRRTSLRRLSLAQWIVAPENPLTARVIVNRVWQFHFGEGLVRTPSDFGLMGEAPTHPELLDWLARWFIDNGWSVKKLHRLILASSAYRMSKAWNPQYGAEDPANLLLWRAPYRRLEVEPIRDSMLAVSGRLNPAMYGPSMYPYVPPAALEGSSDPDKIWKPFDERDASRRTVYAFVKRSMIVPMLEVLDLCDTTKSSAQRSTTAVPTQALTLFNGEFVNRQARYFAERLVEEVGSDPAAQIDRAFRLALARPPKPEERDALLAFLRSEAEAEQAADSPAFEALVQMCRVVFNMNEFVYPD
ncbi:MAG: DUF1553 domain-containing protein [Acidobacteria bacterium]|nr:DUF1553 domain-containing protein [Acidobacteriota bacterium]